MFELLWLELPAKFYSKNEAEEKTSEEKIGEENRGIELKEITVEKK